MTEGETSVGIHPGGNTLETISIQKEQTLTTGTCMNKKYFHPLLFFNAIEGEMSLKEISKKVGCSDPTSERNLLILVKEGKVERLWYGMWYFRRIK